MIFTVTLPKSSHILDQGENEDQYEFKSIQRRPFVFFFSSRSIVFLHLFHVPITINLLGDLSVPHGQKIINSCNQHTSVLWLSTVG